MLRSRVLPFLILAFQLLLTQSEAKSSPALLSVSLAARGHIDNANEIYISGWACNPSSPASAIDIAIEVDGAPAGRVAADNTRETAVAAACGHEAETKHGFFYLFNDATRRILADGAEHIISVTSRENAAPIAQAKVRSEQKSSREIFFEQPKIADPVSKHVLFPETIDLMTDLPSGLYGFALWHVWEKGAAVSRPALWDASACTGFAVPAANQSQAQLGVREGKSPAGIFGTVIQMHGDTTGICLNTETPFRGTLLASSPFYRFESPVQIWSLGSNRQILAVEIELKVAHAKRTAGGEVYAIFYYMFREKHSKKRFWYGAQLFDLRSEIPEQLISDNCSTCTGWPILISSFSGGMYGYRAARQGDPEPGRFRSTVWQAKEDYTPYHFVVTIDNFDAAIGALRQKHPELSIKREDYELEGVFLNPEVYKSGELGLSYKNWRVYGE